MDRKSKTKLRICDADNESFFFTDFRAVIEPNTLHDKGSNGTSNPRNTTIKEKVPEAGATQGKSSALFSPLKKPRLYEHETDEIIPYSDLE